LTLTTPCTEIQLAGDSGESGDKASSTDQGEVNEGAPTATFNPSRTLVITVEPQYQITQANIEY